MKRNEQINYFSKYFLLAKKNIIFKIRLFGSHIFLYIICFFFMYLILIENIFTRENKREIDCSYLCYFSFTLLYFNLKFASDMINTSEFNFFPVNFYFFLIPLGIISYLFKLFFFNFFL